MEAAGRREKRGPVLPVAAVRQCEVPWDTPTHPPPRERPAAETPPRCGKTGRRLSERGRRSECVTGLCASKAEKTLKGLFVLTAGSLYGLRAAPKGAG